MEFEANLGFTDGPEKQARRNFPLSTLKIHHRTPTNRSVGGFNLIPVAVARDIRQAMPVSGNFVGLASTFIGMNVEVSVKA